MQEISKILENNAVLAKSDFKAEISNLPAYQGKYIQNALSTQIKALGSEIGGKIADIVSLSSQFAGYNLHANPNEFKVTCNLLISELLEVYPNATIDEIGTAIRKGIRGEYGEYVGLSVKNMIGFIRSYMEDEDRKQAIKLYQQRKKDMEQKVKTPEEIEAIFKSCYELDIEMISRGEFVIGNRVEMFNWCERNGLIKMSLAEKKALKDEVIENLNYMLSKTADHDMRIHLKHILSSEEAIKDECRKETYLKHIKTKSDESINLQ